MLTFNDIANTRMKRRLDPPNTLIRTERASVIGDIRVVCI